MKKVRLLCWLAILAAAVSLSPAKAQVYVSSTGTGATCSAGTPCALSTAINVLKNNQAETVACINGGNATLPPTSITNSFVIDCPGGVVGLSAPLTLTGTSTQIVKLRNLTFSGYFGGSPNEPFIRVTGGATLIIENCRFEDEGHQPSRPAHHPR
jgi:hypothetical protein